MQDNIRIIQGTKSRDVYYCNITKMTVTDKEGNCIKLYTSIESISDKNLSYHLDTLFHELYKLTNEFKEICIWENKGGNDII